MPTVPSFSDPSQQVKPQALPNVQLNVNPSAEAFGGGQSQQNLANATENMGRAFVDVAQEQRARADQIAHIQADTQASQLQTQIQLKVANMKGQDAFGAPDVADQMWQEGISKIRGNLNGQNQQLAFDQTSATRYQDLNKSVQMHVNQQGNEFADQTDQSAITQATNEAVVNAGDNSIVGTNLLRIEDLTQNYARRHGIPEDSDVYKELLTKNLSSAHRDVIQAKLEAGLDNDAKDYFRDNKVEMQAGDVLHAATALDGAEVIGQGRDMWDKISSMPGMKFQDGSLNVEKMRSAMQIEMDSEDMSDRRQEQIMSFVKQRGREYNVDRNRQAMDLERSFVNAGIQARQNGQSREEADSLVSKFGSDPYDQMMKRDTLDKLYAPPTKSDNQTYMAIWTGIQDGTVTKPMIDQAQLSNKINGTDSRDLLKEYYKAQQDGADPRARITWGWINERVKQQIPDKDAAADFMRALKTDTLNKTPEEVEQRYNQLLKVAPGTGWFGSNFRADRQYQTEAKQLEDSSAQWGNARSALGDKQTDAIGSAVMYMKQSQNYNVKDVNEFANVFGGVDNIKKGTPVNNAIVSLQVSGQFPTPTNIKAVLDRYPDGNAPKGAFK